MYSHVLSAAWQIYRQKFGTIAIVVVIVWLPCELLSCYLDAHVFGPDDFVKSFKVYRLLDNFIGIIATAGVTVIALNHHSGRSSGVADAFSASLAIWGRMWWTRLLRGLLVVLGLLLLILPGLFLSIRLCFVESVVVAEGESGRAALQRSFELTRGQFWRTLGMIALLIGIIGVPMILTILPMVFFVALDNWLVDTALAVVHNVMVAFFFVAMLCAYKAQASVFETAVQYVAVDTTERL